MTDKPDTTIRSRSSHGSYLVEPTRLMEKKRRVEEQDGHRQLTKAKVHEREFTEDYLSVAPEGETNGILEHPLLDGQIYDGADIQISQLPYLNRDAKTKYENAQREQQLEHQLRLGLMPKMGTAPKPER